MWPFGKESAEDKRKRELQELTVSALERGELPPIARQRLEERKALGSEFFTSDLSTREFLLCREAGFETLGQVMGSCFYKVGFRGYYNRRWSGTGELANLTYAQSEARRLAVSRMEQEAQLLGATGVLGVRLNMRGYDWSSGLMEFTAFGTAVRVPGWQSHDQIFSSDLNGQEFWQLYRAGYRPKGLAFGVCCYYIFTNVQALKQMVNWWGGSKPNQEVDHYTQCFLNARHLAMKRFTADLQRHGADGSVGVAVDYDLEQIEYEESSTYKDVLLSFTALGTAIAKDRQAPPAQPPGTLLCLNLASGSQRLLSAGFSETSLSEYSPALRALMDEDE
jgi:uncharacterized protein YbjQ (UPF0145 family)